jgi:hypothetical protein
MWWSFSFPWPIMVAGRDCRVPLHPLLVILLAGVVSGVAMPVLLCSSWPPGHQGDRSKCGGRCARGVGIFSRSYSPAACRRQVASPRRALWLLGSRSNLHRLQLRRPLRFASKWCVLGDPIVGRAQSLIPDLEAEEEGGPDRVSCFHPRSRL